MSRSSFFAETAGPGQSDLSLLDWYLAEMNRIYNLALGLYSDMEILRDETAAHATAAAASATSAESFSDLSEYWYNLILGLDLGSGNGKLIDGVVYYGTPGVAGANVTVDALTHKRKLLGVRGTNGSFYLPDALLDDLAVGEYVVLYNALDGAAEAPVTYETGGNLICPTLNVLNNQAFAIMLRADVGTVKRFMLLKFEGEMPESPNQLESIIIAASDETTALTAGAAKVTFRMPYALALTSIRGSLSTAQTSGSILTVDVNQDGVSLFSTLLTIDNGERTTITAATQPVVPPITLGIDGEITVDIDQVGDGTAKGLKIMLIGTKPA